MGQDCPNKFLGIFNRTQMVERWVVAVEKHTAEQQPDSTDEEGHVRHDGRNLVNLGDCPRFGGLLTEPSRVMALSS